MAMKGGLVKIYGVGINDSDSVIRPTVNGKVKNCKIYQTWVSMLERCYDTSSLKRSGTYVGCSVCDEWLFFSNFKLWMEKQDWKGKHLDKDILVRGNKVYSPDTCAFVDRMTNNFVLERGLHRGEFMLGVTRGNWDLRFSARCSSSLISKSCNLGRFDTELEAHVAWKRRKHEVACKLADMQKDPRVAKALRERYAGEMPYL